MVHKDEAASVSQQDRQWESEEFSISLWINKANPISFPASALSSTIVTVSSTEYCPSRVAYSSTTCVFFVPPQLLLCQCWVIFFFVQSSSMADFLFNCGTVCLYFSSSKLLHFVFITFSNRQSGTLLRPEGDWLESKRWVMGVAACAGCWNWRQRRGVNWH